MKRFVIAAALAFSALATPIQAQQSCGPADTMAEVFMQRFGERIVAEADMQDGGRLVLLANDQTQSWSLVIIQGGVGCIVAAGSGVSVVPTGLAI